MCIYHGQESCKLRQLTYSSAERTPLTCTPWPVTSFSSIRRCVIIHYSLLHSYLVKFSKRNCSQQGLWMFLRSWFLYRDIALQESLPNIFQCFEHQKWHTIQFNSSALTVAHTATSQLICHLSKCQWCYQRYIFTFLFYFLSWVYFFFFPSVNQQLKKGPGRKLEKRLPALDVVRLFKQGSPSTPEHWFHLAYVAYEYTAPMLAKTNGNLAWHS